MKLKHLDYNPKGKGNRRLQSTKRCCQTTNVHGRQAGRSKSAQERHRKEAFKDQTVRERRMITKAASRKNMRRRKKARRTSIARTTVKTLPIAEDNKMRRLLLRKRREQACSKSREMKVVSKLQQ